MIRQILPRLKELAVRSWGLQSESQHPANTSHYSCQESDNIFLGKNNEILPVIWMNIHLWIYGKMQNFVLWRCSSQKSEDWGHESKGSEHAGFFYTMWTTSTVISTNLFLSHKPNLNNALENYPLGPGSSCSVVSILIFLTSLSPPSFLDFSPSTLPSHPVIGYALSWTRLAP